MRLRSSSFIIALSLAAISVAGTATPAFAQVSDADRNAARELYTEGESLRLQGRYADALDRYNRSFAVFPAPTTAFRAAQCRAALGQLVEAAEQLRAVANANLGAGASEAFLKAKQEAAAELATIEPRIPKLKINVLPAGVQGLSVTVDGVQMSSALVGVGRPINPGTHRVVANAPGFSAAQANVDVREKQQPIPEVTLTLQPGNSGVSYTTNTPPQGNGTTGTPPGGALTTPNPNYNNPAYNPAYANNGGYPPGFTPYGQWIPPARREGPHTALLLGVDTALSIIAGDGAYGGNNNVPIGWNFGADIGLRFARIGYIGAVAQGTFWSVGDVSISSFALDAVLGLITNPEGVGFYGEVGGGLRTNSQSSASGEFVIGLGIQFKAGPLRIIPKFDVYAGPNDNLAGGGGAHAFFTFGASGFWELPLDRPTVVQPPPTY